jgi:hypothetical protein
LRQRPIAALSRTVARFNQRTREPLIINDADRFKSVGGSRDVRFRIARGDQSLDERALTPWGTRERTRSGL